MIYLILILVGVVAAVYGVVKKRDSLFAVGIISSLFGCVLSLCMIIVSVDTTTKVLKARESMDTVLTHPDMIKTDNIHYVMQAEANYNAALLDAQYRKTQIVPLIFLDGLFIPKQIMALERFDGDVKN